MNKSDTVKDYLKRFPNMENKTLANKIYSDYPLIFKDIETVRSSIRYYKGAKGKVSLKVLKDERFLPHEKKQEKYNLPESIMQIYESYKIIAKKALIFGDVHIPFHSISALEAMFDKTVNTGIDAIIIDGDFMDCFDVSYFDNEPDVMRLNEERHITKQALIEIKRIYPEATIYYKFGNHEHRFERYLISKAPEIYDCEEFRLEVLLDLFNLGIKYIPQEKYIDLNSQLPILHGHEYVKSVSSPANPARTLFLRAKHSALTAHNHQSSEHNECRIDNEVITTWSIGCLCGLNPKYMPLNKWNHGYAVYESDGDFWHVENKRIYKGKVL